MIPERVQTPFASYWPCGSNFQTVGPAHAAPISPLLLRQAAGTLALAEASSSFGLLPLMAKNSSVAFHTSGDRIGRATRAGAALGFGVAGGDVTTGAGVVARLGTGVAIGVEAFAVGAGATVGVSEGTAVDSPEVAVGRGEGVEPGSRSGVGAGESVTSPGDRDDSGVSLSMSGDGDGELVAVGAAPTGASRLGSGSRMTSARMAASATTMTPSETASRGEGRGVEAVEAPQCQQREAATIDWWQLGQLTSRRDDLAHG